MFKNLVRLIVACLLAGAFVPATSANAVSTYSTSATNLRLSDIKAHSVHLSWNAPSWGADGITDYQVDYKATADNAWTTFTHTVSTDTSITVTGLSAGTAYNFRVSPVIVSTVQPSKTLGIKQVVVGMSHACALTDAGEIYCWGDNASGQLGNSDSTLANSSSPVRVTGVVATSIAAGRDHTCALVADGTIYCWGSNSNGQLGTGDTSYLFSATPRLVSGISNATNIATGAMHACAVVDNGAVKCWGTGAKFRLGLASSYAQNDVSTPTSVAGLSGLTVVQVSAGTSQSCVLLNTKAVKCWGDNATGQLGAGATSSATPSPRAVTGIDGTTSSAVQISMGSQHACAVLTDGTAKCWGNGGSGRIGNAATTTAATPASVKMGGNVLTGIRAVASGSESSCAIINSGEVVCWGNNASGQLGNGSLVSQSQAVSTGITNAIAIAADLGSNVAGAGHNCALLSDSTVKCWGTGTNYVLGNGLTSSSSSPVLTAVGAPASATPVGAPDAPAWGSITPKLRSLELNWVTQSNNGSPLTAITVLYSGGSKDGQVACRPAVSETSCTIINLNPVETYSISISASNALGVSSATISDAYATKTSGVAGNFSWADISSSMTITGCTGACNEISVPDSIEGDPVTSVGDNAFNTGQVGSLVLPNSVMSIASTALGNQLLPFTNFTNFGAQISGTPNVGSALSVSGNGWLAKATKQYAWLRDGQVISGANGARYIPTTEDFGKEISALVTLRRDGFVTTTLSSQSVTVGAGALPRTSTPSISGVFRVGQVLSAKAGSWTIATDLNYQWCVNGIAVSNATQTTYTIALSDLGKSISLEVTGTKFGYVNRTRTSVSHVALPGIQSDLTGLSIVGTAKVGQTLNSSVTGNQFSFQWLRNGVSIPGANSSSYVSATSDAGRYLSLRVTSVKTGYVTATKTVKMAVAVSR